MKGAVAGKNARKKIVSARGGKYESYKFNSGIGNQASLLFSPVSLVSCGSYWRSLGGLSVLSLGLGVGGVSRVLRGEFRFRLLLSWSWSSWSWSRLFIRGVRSVRSGVKVKKGIVIQEMERPPPSGCCRLAVIGGI